MVWDAQKTVQQHGQHGEYNLQREGDDKTRVRFTITVEPSAPLPEFWVKRARKKILVSATRGPATARDGREGISRLEPVSGARPVV